MCPQQVGRDASWFAGSRTNTLQGLNNSKVYDLLLYASRTTSGQTTRFTVSGTNIDILTTQNYTNVATFSNITPINGKIIITISSLNTYNYLNGFTIIEKSPSNISPTANAGSNQTIVLPVSSVNLTGSGNDPDGTIASYAWTQVSGTGATITSPSAQNTSITGLTTEGVRVFRLTVTDNQGATGFSEVAITVNAGNQSPTANAGSNQTIVLPVSTVNLTGSGNDPDGTIASYAWTQVSGTGATITSPSAQNTSITGLTTAGVRVFRLTVTDNLGATGSSEVTITVNAGNQSPTANAGSNETIVLPVSSVNLTGTGNDPDGTIASYAWTQVSGTGATITSPSAQNTSITGLTTAGVRVFRLTVTDNLGATGTSDVTITVNAANQAPTANAGSNQTITLPTSQVSLSGTAYDNDGTIVSIFWTKIAGGSASITNPTSLSTTVTGLTLGSYVFRLTATDNSGATGSSDVTITVSSFSSSKTINVNIYGSAVYNNAQWNNWQTTNSLTSNVFNYTDGSSSGLNAVLSAQSNYADNGLNYPVTMCPQQVGRDASWFAGSRTNTLQGLNNSKVYDLLLYASRTTSGQTTRFTVSGTNIDILTTQNYTNVATFSNITPINGKIIITISSLNTYNYLNGFTIIEKSPSNISPTANAGSDETIVLPVSSVNLTGSGNDPDGTIASYAWTQVSGTGATITSPSAQNTSITGLTTAGVRVFRLTVTDNQGATGLSEVTITVNASNQAPTANAGSNQTIVLPVSTVNLTGSGNDPDGTIASYVWTQVSGTGATITSPSAQNTSITGLTTAGARIFRLTVTDNLGATGFSNVTITVNNFDIVPPSISTNNPQTITDSSVSFSASVNSNYAISSTSWTKFSVPGQTLKRITVVGSSTSEGTGASVPDSSFVNKLKKYYKDQGLIDTIYNLSVGGTSPFDLIITQALNKGAEILLVNYPSNNYTEGNRSATIARFQEIKDSSDGRGVQFYCTGTQPRDNYDAAGRLNLVILNDSLRNRFGDRFIDFMKPTLNTFDNTLIPDFAYGDQTHVNNKGHELFFQLVKAKNIFSKIGNSTSIIASPSSSSTIVTRLIPGIHQFQVSIIDSRGLAASAVAKVTVAFNLPPTANAGSDQTIVLPVSTVNLTGSGNDPDGTIASYAWTQVSGTGATITSPSAQNTSIAGLTTAGVRVFRLTVTDNQGATGFSEVTITVNAGNQSPTANAGSNQTIVLPVSTVNLTGSGNDPDGTIASYAWTQVSGTGATITSPSAQNTSITGLTTAGVRVFRLTVTDNQGATGLSEVTITVNASNQAPTANAGSDQTTVLPVSSVNLTGSGNDPDGTIASYAWTQVSGTGATITNPSAQNTSITGLTTAGARIFRLTVTDNLGATGTSEVTITVNAANQAPTANAGSNQTIVLPVSSANLTGTGNDPDGTIASYAWTQVSGTGATITSPSAQNTSITGLTTAGVRVFRLTVTDNLGATGTSDVTITVNAANQAPTANAGSNQTITLPTSQVSLSGTAYDNDGTIVSILWTKIAGGSASITNPTSLSTTVTGLTLGSYVFRLTATDNAGATGSSDVTITVSSFSSSKTINVNIYGSAVYNNAQWNNWQTTNSLTSNVFNYTDGSSSGINAVLSAQSSYADNGLTYPVTMCPQQVGRDASWSTTTRTMTLQGLNNTMTYDIKIYTSRTTAGQSTRFTVNGTNIDILTTQNYSNVVTFTNINPVNGRIVIAISSLNTYNYINGFTIIENYLNGQSLLVLK